MSEIMIWIWIKKLFYHFVDENHYGCVSFKYMKYQISLIRVMRGNTNRMASRTNLLHDRDKNIFKHEYIQLSYMLIIFIFISFIINLHKCLQKNFVSDFRNITCHLISLKRMSLLIFERVFELKKAEAQFELYGWYDKWLLIIFACLATITCDMTLPIWKSRLVLQSFGFVMLMLSLKSLIFWYKK